MKSRAKPRPLPPETYGFGVLNEGLAIGVAKNIKIRPNEFTLPARTVVDISGPVGVVTSQAQQVRLRQALVEGILTRYLPPAGQNTSSRARVDPDICRQAEKGWLQARE